MKAKISTVIKTNEDRMWRELQKTSSLMHVAAPMLMFKPQTNHALPESWSIGVEYKLKLFFFGLIPLGDHCINLVEFNHDEKTIVSNEYGRLTDVWNHVIKIKAIDEQTLEYTDEIEIKAGMLTFSIWLFAHLFYRHRQRRWKELLNRQSISG